MLQFKKMEHEDFEELNNIKGLGVRIFNYLENEKITTHRDLALKCYEYFTNKLGMRKWQGKKTYKEFVMSRRSLGEKSVAEFINYLDSIDYNFEKNHAKEIYDEEIFKKKLIIKTYLLGL